MSRGEAILDETRQLYTILDYTRLGDFNEIEKPTPQK